jgi:dihydrofolate reductase
MINLVNILYMTISADGFIATPADETPWSEASWESFNQFEQSCDLVLVGRKTFEIMSKNDELSDNVNYAVITDNQNFNTHGYQALSIHSSEDIPKKNKVGIIGGSTLNGKLARLGIIDEIILDIEPIVLGRGVNLFGSFKSQINLELVSSKIIGKETTQNHYKVKK